MNNGQNDVALVSDCPEKRGPTDQSRKSRIRKRTKKNSRKKGDPWIKDSNFTCRGSLLTCLQRLQNLKFRFLAVVSR